MGKDRDHSVIFEIVSKYCISNSFVLLSEDGEHFTWRDIHVDAVVGNDPRVPLGDIFQAETWMHAEAGRRVGRPCQKLVRSGSAAARRATPDLNM